MYHPIFPYNILKSFPASLAYSSVLIDRKATSKSVQRHTVLYYRSYPNFGQTDHNFHNHVFDDVICKPTIRWLGQEVYLLSCHSKAWKKEALRPLHMTSLYDITLSARADVYLDSSVLDLKNSTEYILLHIMLG